MRGPNLKLQVYGPSLQIYEGFFYAQGFRTISKRTVSEIAYC
jgi:hypothetical protein